MDKFLDTYDLPKLNLDIIKHLNNYITNTEFETVTNSPNKKMSSTGSIHC
jgi:hypothetical protein